MELEIQVSVNFLMNYLYNKLPRRRVDLFGEELAKKLTQKFEGHWYPEKPQKGSAFRCILISEKLDPVLVDAAKESGLKVEDVKANLPEKLCLWIDPHEVSYRIGEQGSVSAIYKKENTTFADEISDAETARWVGLLNGHNATRTKSFERSAERASPTLSNGSSSSSSPSPVMGQSFAPYFAWSTAEDVTRKPRSKAPRIPSPLSPNAQEFSPIKQPIGRPWTFPRTERQEGRRHSPLPANLDWLAFADMPYRDNFHHSQMPIMA